MRKFNLIFLHKGKIFFVIFLLLGLVLCSLNCNKGLDNPHSIDKSTKEIIKNIQKTDYLLVKDITYYAIKNSTSLNHNDSTDIVHNFFQNTNPNDYAIYKEWKNIPKKERKQMINLSKQFDDLLSQYYNNMIEQVEHLNHYYDSVYNSIKKIAINDIIIENNSQLNNDLKIFGLNKMLDVEESNYINDLNRIVKTNTMQLQTNIINSELNDDEKTRGVVATEAIKQNSETLLIMGIIEHLGNDFLAYKKIQKSRFIQPVIFGRIGRAISSSAKSIINTTVQVVKAVATVVNVAAHFVKNATLATISAVTTGISVFFAVSDFMCGRFPILWPLLPNEAQRPECCGFIKKHTVFCRITGYDW